MTRVIEIFLILFFIAFVGLVPFQYFHPVVNVKKVNESRTLVEWPKESLWLGLKYGAGYATTVEHFFSDHFPLRDVMLRSLGQFEYSALGRSREVIVGKNGWLSDKKVLTEQLHQLDKVSDEQIKSSVLKLKRLQQWLHDRNIRFLMVIIPMKPTLYAENFPDKFVKRPQQTGLQRFQNALLKNDIAYVDALKVLGEHKNEGSLYYKTDMHWNTAGTTYVAEAIINYLSTNILGTPIWREQVTKSEQDFSGAELSTMPLLFPKSEMTPAWASANPGYTSRVVGEGPTAIEVYLGTDKSRALLPPSIMFGNSFMLQYPTVGYHNYFSESTRVLDYQYFSKALDYIKPEHKIFILHIYETQLFFHILPPDSFGYWDKRIEKQPLPVDFVYK